MKFETEDKKYLADRKAFSEKYGSRELWSVIDHWPLYVGVGNLARFMAIRDLFLETLDVPGHVAEFGSWRGANLMFMSKLIKIADPHGPKKIHCFEGFEGLETFAPEDNSDGTTQGTYSGNEEELRDAIELYQMQDDIVIHKGNILKTLPEDLQKDEGLSFSFIYCDTDLYGPTKLILDQCHSRLSKGGVFVLDEWNDEKWPGEAIAVREFMEEHGDFYEMKHVHDARQPSLILRKIK